jgi:hypothetical protein
LGWARGPDSDSSPAPSPLPAAPGKGRPPPRHKHGTHRVWTKRSPVPSTAWWRGLRNVAASPGDPAGHQAPTRTTTSTATSSIAWLHRSAGSGSRRLNAQTPKRKPYREKVGGGATNHVGSNLGLCPPHPRKRLLRSRKERRYEPRRVEAHVGSSKKAHNLFRGIQRCRFTLK